MVILLLISDLLIEKYIEYFKSRRVIQSASQKKQSEEKLT